MKPEKAIYIILLVSLMTSTVSLIGQQKPKDPCACAIIDKKSSAQFITYEGFSESSSEVKLRIRNNTTCAIIIETDLGPATIFRKLPGGGFRLEVVNGSEDGALIHAHYLIHEPVKWPELIEPYDWGDVVSEYEILGGQTAVFYVPISKFKRGYDVAVPFDYAWDHHRNAPPLQGAVDHVVHFRRENIPEVLLRKSP